MLYCIRHIQNSGIFTTLFIQVYAGIFKHIQHYYGIFTQIETLLRHIQAYSGIFRTLCNLAIFLALAYLELEAYSKPYETLTRHIQNSAIVRTVYSDIIQPYSAIFRVLRNPCILAAIWNVGNPGILRTLPKLHPKAYSVPCHIHENR